MRENSGRFTYSPRRPARLFFILRLAFSVFGDSEVRPRSPSRLINPEDRTPGSPEWVGGVCPRFRMPVASMSPGSCRPYVRSETFTRRESEDGMGPPTSPAAVEMHGVRRTYGRGDSAVHALRGIDMALPRGTFTALMGPSGSGKSTFLQCAAWLDRPSAGS